jgi:hypothetical protein
MASGPLYNIYLFPVDLILDCNKDSSHLILSALFTAVTATPSDFSRDLSWTLFEMLGVFAEHEDIQP